MYIESSKFRNGAFILAGCAGNMSSSTSSGEMVHCVALNLCKGN